MDGHSEAPCLGCSKVFRVPSRIFKMAERYDDNRIVLFCSRSCNLSWVAKTGLAHQETRMRNLIESLEKTND